MKKKQLKHLQLNKKSISQLDVTSVKGANDSNNRQCYSEQNLTACYWEPGCESARLTLCC